MIRGRGMIQLTGRDNYTRFQTHYNNHYRLQDEAVKDFVNNENDRSQLTNNGKIALLSTVWFWNTKVYSRKDPIVSSWNKKNLYEIADDTINGDPLTKQKGIDIKKSVYAISIGVNGGTNGLKDRWEAYQRIKNANIFQDFPSKK